MRVTILGTGAYGIALSSVLYHNHHEVIMWSKFEEEILELEKTRTSPKLPSYIIPSDIIFTTDMKWAISGSSLIIIAVPSIFVDDTVKELQSFFTNQHLCIASKGFSVYDVVLKYIKTDRLGVISGPSFAIDMIRKVPIGLSLGTNHLETARLIQSLFTNEYFKFYVTNDIRGIEICGSIKNVMAIGAGMLMGMGLPESTRAIYITECLHDMKDLIKTLGGDSETILSFAGIGDLLLTCTSSKSRNFSFGYLIGSNVDEKEIDLYKKQNTIEGLSTLYSIYALYRVPIVDLIYDIVENKKSCEELKRFLIEKK